MQWAKVAIFYIYTRYLANGK